MNNEVDYDDRVPEISGWFKDMPGFEVKSGFGIPKRSKKSKKSKKDLKNKSSPNKISLIQQLAKSNDKSKVDVVVPFSKTTHSLNISKDSSETKDPQVPSKTFLYKKAELPPKLYPIL